jgi:predicted MFS family arabinose efflux permease
VSHVRQYAIVTGAYWSFTLTDGALRLIVLLHFHELGYTPIQLASLFLLYEFFGIVTNLFGGWLAARTGMRLTLVAGLALQAAALVLLAGLQPEWAIGLSVAYVMACQALSGIAKDLTKMSAKSAIKSLVPGEGRLFTWVALLTGSKNALKGLGFFVGAALLAGAGFRGSLLIMAVLVTAVLVGVLVSLPGGIGKAKARVPFSGVFSKTPAINRLSTARLFLFAARDVWFVVSVPIFLASVLGWSFMEVGGFLALWVIGYGAVQAGAPRILGAFTEAPGPGAALALAAILAVTTAAIPLGLRTGPPATVMLVGLAIFGIVFALNSSVHSYLILAYSDMDKVALNVGFYYMANAGGRLFGTLLSGLTYQYGGAALALWTSAALALVTALLSLALPPLKAGLHVPLAAAADSSD